MDIQTRQRHLSEMGVPQWHARFVLVGAAKTPKFNMLPVADLPSITTSQLSSVVSHDEELENTSLAVEVAGETAGSLIGELSDPGIEKTISEVETSVEVSVNVPEIVSDSASSLSTRVSVKHIPNVSLGAFVSDKYLVISGMDGQMSHLEEMSLLQNIIRAIDTKSAMFEFGGGFNWPVFKSAKVLVGQELLHEELIVRWLASFDLAQSRVLMCFGGETKKIIEKLLESQSREIGVSKAVFFDDSLADLYKVPLRKRSIWKVISENAEKFN